MQMLNEETWTTTQSAVFEAMVMTLRAFVAGDPDHRSMSVAADEVRVTHRGRTWAWRIAAGRSMNINVGGLTGQVEIWAREDPPRERTLLDSVRGLASPHSSPTGTVIPSDDPRVKAEQIVRRELARQTRGSVSASPA